MADAHLEMVLDRGTSCSPPTEKSRFSSTRRKLPTDCRFAGLDELHIYASSCKWGTCAHSSSLELIKLLNTGSPSVDHRVVVVVVVWPWLKKRKATVYRHRNGWRKERLAPRMVKQHWQSERTILCSGWLLIVATYGQQINYGTRHNKLL